MTRQSFQRGHLSKPVGTLRGLRFKARFRVRSAHGGWKHRNTTIYAPNIKAARVELQRIIREALVQRHGVADLTFREFVNMYWKPYLERQNVKPSTRASYLCALDKHFLPVFGDMRLADISPLDIEGLVQKKQKQTAKTVRNLVGLLQGIFSLAVENELLPRSPVRNKHKPAWARRMRRIWTAEQVNSIVAAAPAQHRGLFICAALTGARLGELLGLQWKHIDLNERKLKIEQSLWQGKIVPPKTPGSIRTILFGNILAMALTEHLQNAAQRAPEDFVFSKADGSLLHPDVLRKDVLYPVLDRLNIPRGKRDSGFHTFRHSAASLVNEKTGNLKLAQTLLGHSNLSTTADIYTHPSAEAEREAALALERAIYGEVFPQLFPSGNKSVAVQ